MNVKFTTLFVAIALLAPSLGQAGQALGTAKSRGDFRPFAEVNPSTSRIVARSRPVYRSTAPQSAPVIVRSAPVIREVPGPVVAQVPTTDAARRFSQAPASENGAVSTAKPCPERASVASQPSSGRRYSYAPAPASSGNFSRSYSSNSGRSNTPTWAQPKTDSRKFNSR
jgi:hypothetical protein